MKDPRAIEPLFRQLSDDDFHVIKNVIKALRKFGSIVISPAIQRLKHRNANARRAAMLLIESFGKESLSYLIQEIEKENWVVSNRLVHLIWKIGKIDSEDVLIQFLPNKHVQKNVIIMLGTLKSVSSIPSLIKLYEEKPLRRLILYAIKLIGPKTAFPVIIQSLRNISIKSLTEELIIKIGSPMVPYLLATLEKKNQSRVTCVKLLERIGPDPVISQIKQLANANPEVKMLTKGLLKKYQDKKKKTKEKKAWLSFFSS